MLNAIKMAFLFVLKNKKYLKCVLKNVSYFKKERSSKVLRTQCFVTYKSHYFE